ncbi:MAG: hypothetical protein JNK35_11490 [Phycisphaerae bacterium]|nr:hypothetical protein [Phycisphaerae bacterium]
MHEHAISEIKPAAPSATPSLDHGPLWHVLHCRSRQEKCVAETLTAQGLAAYLPIVAAERRYGHRRRRVEFPLFAGYVFMHGRRVDAFPLISGKRVVRVIPVPDQARFEIELGHVREALARGAYLDPCPAITAGWRVRVAKGPFMGVEGLVEQKLRPDRLVLQIDVLGQGAALDISAFEIEAIAPPPAEPALKGGR